MSLMHWEPFAGSEDIFNRLFPVTFARWPRVTGVDTEWRPTADISETDKEYLIRAQLPAVKREDVKVTVDADTITVRGERKKRIEDKTEKYHRIESLEGTFMRSFSLPEGADPGAIRCDHKDGELVIHIPKKAPAPSAAAAREIPIS